MYSNEPVNAFFTRYSAFVEASQIYYFTGKNRFALEEERMRWEHEFSARHGAENFNRLKGAGLSLRDLLDEVSVAPFLAEKRFVSVEGVPRFTPEEFETLFLQIHPSVILLFSEEEGARPTNASKALLEKATVKTFPEMKGPKLSAWVIKRAQEEGAALPQDGAMRLIDLTGDDQRFLDQQVRILALKCQGGNISVADVELMTVPAEKALWGVTNALAAGQQERALSETRELLRAGADPFAIWNTILSFVRQLALLSAAMHGGVTSPQALADRTGIHPYVIRTLQPCARKLSPEMLRPVIDRAVDLDVAFKTGLLRTTDDATAEMTAVLDTFLLRFPQS